MRAKHFDLHHLHTNDVKMGWSCSHMDRKNRDQKLPSTCQYRFTVFRPTWAQNALNISIKMMVNMSLLHKQSQQRLLQYIIKLSKTQIKQTIVIFFYRNVCFSTIKAGDNYARLIVNSAIKYHLFNHRCLLSSKTHFQSNLVEHKPTTSSNLSDIC